MSSPVGSGVETQLCGDAADPSGSLNTLRMALINMKERCQRQQKRIEELEKENMLIRTSRGDLYREVKKLHEANMTLREKNLQLNQKLHKKTKENVEVREQLTSLQDHHSDSIKQLERLQSEVTALAFAKSPSTSSSIDLSTPRESIDKEYLSGGDLDPDLVYDDEEERVVSLVSETQMADIRAKAIEQREKLKAAIKEMTDRLYGKDNGGQGQSDHGASSNSSVKKCPMCEVTFDDTVSQEDFEAHVFEHFNYEESDTLRNFDLVPDAMPFA